MARHKQENSEVRSRIVTAAYKVLAEKGYDQTTIKEIAQTAGVAPGLIHYYFASKDDLLLAVLKEASDQYTHMMMQRAAAGGEVTGLVIRAMNEPKERVERQPEWYRLRYELFAMGLRNPGLMPGVAALLANAKKGISMTAGKITGKDRPEDNQALAAILLACFDGLALQKLADPGMDLDVAYDLLARLPELLAKTEQ